MTQDELDDLQLSWEQHPFTKRSQVFFEKRANEVLQELLGKCAQSTDPQVAGAYHRYRAINETTAYFRHQSGRK